jgi:hypothetical protein
MPKVGVARNLNLSELVNRLSLDTAQQAKELRSRGQDLYVKDSSAQVLISEPTRKQQCESAIAVVRDGLSREYGCSQQDSERIMTNVFGGVPTKITAGEARQLHQLGTIAQTHVAHGMDQVSAFELARLAEKLKGRGLNDGDALAAARMVQSSMAKGRPEEASITGVLTSRSVSSGAMTPYGAMAATRVNHNARRAFLDALKDTMAGLPRYTGSSGAQKAVWVNIANLFGDIAFVPIDAKSLATDHKASLLQALSDKVIDCERANDSLGTVMAYRAVVRFNKAITLDELLPPGEQLKMDSFLKKCGANRVIASAKQNWPNLKERERKLAIETIIKLHAQAFGFEVPLVYFHFVPMDPDVLGGLSTDGRTLMLNPTQPEFDDFDFLFNTVVHESTHKYQQQLTFDVRFGTLGPTDSRFDQARLMAANNTAVVGRKTLASCGFSDLEAVDGYRGAPIEQHAFHWGDYAQSRIVDHFR